MKYFIANWKMYLTRAEALELASTVVSSNILNDASVVLCPSFLHLEAVDGIIAHSQAILGAQDVYFESVGAFTSAISVQQLKELAVSYVLVGHSERRKYFGETDELINKKIKALLPSGMQPVVCIGETAIEHSEGKTHERVDKQIQAVLQGLQSSHIIIAYEPIWAIGTGVTLSIDDVTEVHGYIKKKVKEYSGAECEVLYGGSITPENIKEFWSAQNVDGVLVGGSSTQKDKLSALLSLISN